MPQNKAARHLLGLRVADLGLWLDAGDSGVQLTTGACHSQFPATIVRSDDLMLRVRDERPCTTDGRESTFYDAGTWQLWLDRAGRYVFAVPMGAPPPRQLIVDPAFTTGEIIGEFRSMAAQGQTVYPLQDMDVVLYANWLANYGDLILHASGMAIDGRGYAFAGPAGSGKSTLVTALVGAPATVLGEDTVILRHKDGRFWIYGTPWHLDPERCSPEGVPLEKLFFLERRGGHSAQPLPPADGVARLLQTAFVPYYRPDAVSRILGTLSHLAGQVPFYTLGFQLGADVMQLIREA